MLFRSPLDAEPLDVARPTLDLLLDRVDLRVHSLELVVQRLHLLDLRVELRVRGGDGQPRVRVRLPQTGEGEPRVEDLALQRRCLLRERAGFVVV